MAQHWSRKDETDFTNIEWTIHPDDSGPRVRSPFPKRLEKPMSQKEALQKILLRFISFEDQLPTFKKWIVAKVANQTSSSIGFDKNTGEFFDKKSNQIIPAAQAYDLYKDESVKHRSFLRTMKELGVLYGVEGTVYYSSPAAQDFDYDWDVAGKMIFRKEKWRMDDNDWFFNQIGHPLTGMWAHQMTRNNGYGPIESFLVGFAMSSVWEILIEYREKISINDMILTPVSGAIMGEVMFQFQRAFSSGRQTVAHRILSALFSGPEELGRLLHGRRPVKSDSLSEFGFANDFPRSLDLILSAQSDSTVRAGVQGEIIKLEDYGQAGVKHEVISNVPIAELLMAAGVSTSGQIDFFSYFKTALVALHKKRIEQNKDGSTKGYELLLAPSHAFRMDMINSKNGDSPVDRFASASLVGGTGDLSIFLGETSVRIVLDMYADFSAVRSIAFYQYSRTNDVTGAPDILLNQNQSYYFGWGRSGSSRVHIQRGNFDAGLRADRADVFSINGLARWQERTTKDYVLKDSRTNSDIWVGYRSIKKDWLHMSVGAETRSWNSQIPDVSVKVEGSRTQLYSKIRLAF